MRQTRIVIKRYFKIDRTYTNDQGNFTSSKYFNNKVHIIVKFKNNDIKTRGLRGRRFYQTYLPIKHSIGKFKGNLNNITFTFTEGPDLFSRGYRNWWAAQLMNAYREYNDHANALGIGTLPNLVVLVTNWLGAAGAGATPMNRQRNNEGTAPNEWIQYFVAAPGNTIETDLYNSVANGILLRKIDMTLGYRINNRWLSDRIKALMYHEMTHAAHYNKVGQQWWNSLVYAEMSTIVRWDPPFDPYGDGTDEIASEYISVAESWAEHVARVMCDRQYGGNSSGVIKQGFLFLNGGNPNPALTSHLNSIEAYDPNRPVADDPFRWIPEGIYYDLIDARNEFLSPITDNVSGYTNQQLFNALDADVTSMPQYRTRLLQENGNNQATQVTDLFNQYHY